MLQQVVGARLGWAGLGWARVPPKDRCFPMTLRTSEHEIKDVLLFRRDFGRPEWLDSNHRFTLDGFEVAIDAAGNIGAQPDCSIESSSVIC